MRFTEVITAAAIGYASAAMVQKPYLRLPRSAAVHRDATKKIFVDSYDPYRKYAWGHDDLSPLSKGTTTTFSMCSGLTIIHAQDIRTGAMVGVSINGPWIACR